MKLTPRVFKQAVVHESLQPAALDPESPGRYPKNFRTKPLCSTLGLGALRQSCRRASPAWAPDECSGLGFRV